MSRAESLIRQVHDAGGRLVVRGDRMRVVAPRPLPSPLIDALRSAKTEIIPLIAPDWVARFEERAAILEFDAELPRPEAERRAWAFMLVEWMDENPAPDRGPDACAHCGTTGEPLLTLASGTLVHDRCHPAMLEDRRRVAANALMAAGIPPGGALTDG